jgi:quercetin dioxygenase-like cupin family protein
MKSLARQLVPAVLFACLIVMWSAAQQRKPVTVTRIFTGADGQTHAEDIYVKLAPRPGRDGYFQSETVKATGMQVVRAAPGYTADWHTAPGRQYIITISGRREIELPGGQKIPMAPGRILLAEDLTGKGHLTRTVGAEDRVSLIVPLAGQ